MKAVSVIDAKYLEGYKLQIVFDDLKTSIVDFAPFLNSHSHPQYNKYKEEKYFKKFKIENGNIVWGKDWDLIFPVWNLYNGIAAA